MDQAAEHKPANDAPVADAPRHDGASATTSAPTSAAPTGTSLGDHQIKAKAASSAGSVVGPADAPEEKAADAEADRVMRMPNPTSSAPAEKDPALAAPAPDPGRAPEVSPPPAIAPGTVRRKEMPPEAGADRHAAPTPATPTSEPSTAKSGAVPEAVTPAGTAPLKAGVGAAGGAPGASAEPPAAAGEAPARTAPEVPKQVQEYLDASRGKGAPIPEQTRREFEAKFQRSFDDVSIHDDGQADDAARQLDAPTSTSAQAPTTRRPTRANASSPTSWPTSSSSGPASTVGPM